MRSFKNITYELSLKPFFSVKKEDIKATCLKVFENWRVLSETAENISILMWSADGSELLDYSGDLNESFEWAKYVGNANLKYKDRPLTDVGDILQVTTFCENPIDITYGNLKDIVSTLKEVGLEITGKPISVGTTFDPGPEFAKSDFKYNRHREILFGDTMGEATFVCCYSTLKSDNKYYASYPNGIPEGTPFGTFFGSQAEKFMTDMGFDYIWFSNGFGFGSEGWGTTGATFDGKEFHIEKMETAQDKLIEFWNLFREKCHFPIQTRGTNLSVGIDLARDAVNLKKIYNGDFDMLPPPNSPWAALDGDFGLELAGYMSRISELPPEDEYLFRYYSSDPWWMNVPHFSRYEGEPHDIYLPLAIARINKDGEIKLPGYINFLSVDTSLGEIPQNLSNDIIPHIFKALEAAPDTSAPFVWVYPFNEYNDLISARAEKPFFEDWYIRGAINNGLPLSMVVSTDNFIETYQKKPELYSQSVLITPVPAEDSKLVKTLDAFVKSGGKVLYYGSNDGADSKWKKIFSLQATTAISGELTLETEIISGDTWQKGEQSLNLLHNPIISDGGFNCIADENNKDIQVLSSVSDKNGNTRTMTVERSFENGGKAIWIRATNSCYFKDGSYLLQPHNPEEYFRAEILMRAALRRFGWEIAFNKYEIEAKTPVLMLSRNKNALWISGYSADTTVETTLKTPLGAPLLLAYETYFDGEKTYYRFPRALHKECRIFIESGDNGVISCREMPPVSARASRRIRISGLKNANVIILPKTGFENHTDTQMEFHFPYIDTQDVEQELFQSVLGPAIRLKNVTGELMVSDIGFFDI